MSTAAEALAEFRGSGDQRIIGYCYAPDVAFWFALDGEGTVCGPDGRLELSTVFEIHATDGSRELRWLQTTDGSGRSAVLADRTQPVSLPRQRRRLAGEVSASREGVAGPWVTLFSARYGQVDVPVEGEAGNSIEIESDEYVSEDAHGNLTVTGARWVGLRAVGGNRD